MTAALQDYREFANVTDLDIKAMKDHINAVSSREIFDHYYEAVLAWHRSFHG